MEVTPLWRVNVVRISLLVVISKSTGKLQGLPPSVFVKRNGSVGSGFGCLVGGTALANPGVSEIKISPTAAATELASGRHVPTLLFRHDILTPLARSSSNDLEPPSGELIGIRERVNPSPSKPWLGPSLRNLRIANVCDHSCLYANCGLRRQIASLATIEAGWIVTASRATWTRSS
jgi:hypothetical protein